MTIYYVYAYLRSKDSPTAKAGTPYYIGKGHKHRAYVKHTSVSVPADRSKIIFLETHLTEVGALALERRYILWWGRKDLGTGILLNKTNGGEGTSNPSPEHREKIARANRGKSRKWTDTQRERSLQSRIGRKIKNTTNMKNAQRALHQYRFTREDEIFIGSNTDFATKYGHPKASAICVFCSGRSYFGWTREKLPIRTLPPSCQSHSEPL